MSRICILEPSHWGRFRGGAECQTHFLAQHIAESTHHEVFFLSRFTPDDTEGFGYPIIRYSSPPFFQHLRWGQSLDTFSILLRLSQIKPDAILQMQAGAYVGAGVMYAKRARIAHIWYVASDRDLEPAPPVGSESPFRHVDQAMFGWAIRRTTAIIAQTRVQKDKLKAFLGRDADAVIPNFHPAPALPGKSDEQFIVCWIANLKSLKRPQLFVELAKRFAHRSDIRFVMAGRSDDSAAARDAIREISGLGNADYLGELSMEDVNALLERAHLLVNTSEYEGFPNTFIQAWLRGVPVLSINVDPDGLLNSTGLGRMSGDPDRLVADVARFLDDDGMRTACGRECYRYASENFSMKNAENVVRVIEKSIAQARTRD